VTPAFFRSAWIQAQSGRGRSRSPGGYWAVEASLEDVVRERVDLGPVQAGVGGPAEDTGHHPDADVQARRHLPVAAAQGPLLAEDLTKLAHG